MAAGEESRRRKPHHHSLTDEKSPIPDFPLPLIKVCLGSIGLRHKHGEKGTMCVISVEEEET